VQCRQAGRQAGGHYSGAVVIPDVRRPHRDSRERWAAPHASDMKMACISGWKRWRIKELPDHVMILSFIPVGAPLAVYPTGHRVDLTRQVRGEFLRLPKYCNLSILHHVLSHHQASNKCAWYVAAASQPCIFLYTYTCTAPNILPLWTCTQPIDAQKEFRRADMPMCFSRMP
jgi:hypothetical protein